jgi:uncharacterized protein involved in type VI secretion and phage assembly
MNNSLLDLLIPTPDAAGDRIYGMVIGLVTNNQDPELMGRVKVRFPWLSDQDESNWARVLTPMAGNERGMFFLPEVDDEVLVAFEQGDVRFPFVLGALWNGQDKPPETNEDGENNKRFIKSRSGHVIALDDKDGDEKIEIIDNSGKNKIIISTNDNSITISADADISIASNSGTLKLSGSGIEINSQGDVQIEATGNMNLKASALKAEASGNMDLKGLALKAESTANMDLNASAIMNVKGSLVKIN